MRVLVIGANGQVGHELRRRLAYLDDLILTTRSGRLPDAARALALDLATPGSAAQLIARVAPDFVINAAAYTAVDRAEEESEIAFRINAGAVSEVACACAALGATLIHYSTDYVFDGSARAPYRPADPTAPLGAYGASKRAGELAVEASGARHLILRTAWVYGLYGSNFLLTMLRLAGERNELAVVSDQIGCPTPAWLIAEVTARIVAEGVGAGGTHHLVAAGQTSWHRFAESIMDEAMTHGRIARRPFVRAIPTAEYPTLAARPAWSVLDTRSLTAAYPAVLPHWRDALSTTFARRDG